ncbi:competence protein [Ureibacillus manganicus DSM 26584]|uniref:Competence protein n=1 Tax=Ureibacillus manganicus DSM 26584 TaxID=1384049 RepID=A0A0A3J0N9_9BACL|nr:competence protein [Ureibacillus manganicus DSM 26584]
MYKGIIVEPQIRDFFIGRIWTRNHTRFPEGKIEKYIEKGYFDTIKAISIQSNSVGPFTKKQYKCNRCHNSNKQKFIEFFCAKCENKCFYCRHCINMGRMSSCTDLILWKGSFVKSKGNHVLDWEGKFTDSQQKASNELIESLGQNRNHLIHAVTGAGKTEILFPAVYFALNRGDRVCIATPRTDVVLELLPRFQKVFPKTTIHALYGGSPHQSGYAELIITTTHQLYRFENAFDVVIVDEADAFPYTFDESLQKAVIKARKYKAPTVFVTATPSTKILAQTKKEGWGVSFIPRRFHGQPLPVPRFASLWSYNKPFEKGAIPPKLLHWTKQRLQYKEPFLIFFPTIQLMKTATPLFKKIHPNILSVYADDTDRKEKVMKLRNEEIPGLLTTTILERGVTIKNVQVAVVGTESKIFTASALIQISGRVGRNVDFANGDIVYFHHGITTAMDEAKNEILRLNKMGFGRGVD